MRKTRPATLTSSLLARKGEAEPALLADGSVPKDVIALQEELVARVAADITRQVREVPTQEAVAYPAALAPAAGETITPRAEPVAVPPAEIPDAPADEIDVAEALGSAPIELPPGSADEPDYDPAEDMAAQQGSQVTLADWTARAQSGDTPFAYERMSDPETPERSAFVPLALGVTVVAVLATLAIWQVSDHGQIFPQGGGPVASIEASPAQPEAAPPQPDAAAPDASTAPEAQTAAEPAAEAPAPASAPETPAPAVAAAGGFAVQLISTVSQETAESAWAKVAGQVSKAGFTDTHVIERADLGAKGVRYRVKLTGFSSYAAGQKACQTLKAHKLSCLVLRQ